MATTNYHPNRLLFRTDTADQTWLWNSTDSEYHYNKNKSKIDSYYSETNVVYTYNDLGYRTINFNELTDEFILCFGCSYTEGVGVTDTDTWPAMLESEVNMPCINLGIGGSGMHTQLINATQWIKNKMTLPKGVVLQVPEVTRTPNAFLGHNIYAQTGENNNTGVEHSRIYMTGTTPSNRPGVETDENIYNSWKDYLRTFPDTFEHDAPEYHQRQDITPWFLSSQLATVFQLLWNNLGVPVFIMTYDDDGDIVYNPFNVFRITGEFNLDYARDLCHQGPKTHKALIKHIAPVIREMLEWDGVGRQRHDIIRKPQDLAHRTLNEAMASIHKFDTKSGGPFIYE